jgi:hypothetical protein
VVVDQDLRAQLRAARQPSIRRRGRDLRAQRGRGDQIDPGWQRHHLPGRCDDPLGVASAGKQRAYFVTDVPPEHTFTELSHRAGALQPDDLADPRWRGVAALSLQQVSPVDRGCGDVDQYLAAIWCGIGLLAELQYFWAAVLGDGDGAHGARR